jgi:hypothetical protein
MKRILSLILLAAVFAAITFPSGMSSPGKFSDVTESHWAFNFIESLAARGIVAGFPDGTYKPEGTVTRAEWAALLVNAAGLRADDDGLYYSDMNGHWANTHVNAIRKYLPGYADGNFRPDAPAVREDVVVSLVGLLGYALLGYDEPVRFSDMDSISSNAVFYIIVAVQMGLVSGYPDGTFRPRGTLTRAEAAAVLYKAFPPLFGNGLPNVSEEDYRYNEKDGKRHIVIGTYFETFYDSRHTRLSDDPGFSNPLTAQMRLDNVRAIEEKYNVYIEHRNMTFDGLRENIPISIMAGKPGADIYWADAQFLVPCILRGMGAGLESLNIDPARFPYGGDRNVVMQSVKIPGQGQTYIFKPNGINPTIYMMGYNKDMVRAAGLTDPQTLWDRDEWDWETFRRYCVTLTDPGSDVYGWSGYWPNLLQGLLFSNNAAFAPGPTQTLDSPNTMEVLNFMSDLYNVDKAARPWNPNNWYVNNNLYADRKSAFWISTTWLNNEQGGGVATNNPPLPFEFGMVPFPVGPNGNKYTNPSANIEGGYYFIPQFVKDPGLVYDVMYDYTNWFNYNVDDRDDLSWIRDSVYSPENLKYYLEFAKNPLGFDLIFNLGLSTASTEVILSSIYGPAEMTPTQYVVSYRQVFQNALDAYFK